MAMEIKFWQAANTLEYNQGVLVYNAKYILSYHIIWILPSNYTEQEFILVFSFYEHKNRVP